LVVDALRVRFRACPGRAHSADNESGRYCLGAVRIRIATGQKGTGVFIQEPMGDDAAVCAQRKKLAPDQSVRYQALLRSKHEHIADARRRGERLDVHDHTRTQKWLHARAGDRGASASRSL
jgi:hypothetical protein